MKQVRRKGRFFIFEGTDGSGKSTQLRLLYDTLQNQGVPVVATREPTDGKYGKKIRELYTNRDQCSKEEELELFLADRREHVETLILPALAEGKVVLCDRYVLSTVAYQGAIGFDPAQIFARHNFAPQPDLAFLFTLPVHTGLERIIAGRGESPNDFEQEATLTRVAKIFASLDLPYIIRIDATRSIDYLQQLIYDHIQSVLTNMKDESEQ